MIWATLYLESWKRRSAELSYQWGTIDTKGEMLSEPRVQYQVYISVLNDKICKIEVCLPISRLLSGLYGMWSSFKTTLHLV